jgi:hypothetical protein
MSKRRLMLAAARGAPERAPIAGAGAASGADAGPKRIRVRRVRGKNGLLAPHRVGRNQEKTHDETIVSDKVNDMRGTDMSLEEGRADVFIAVEQEL